MIEKKGKDKNNMLLNSFSSYSSGGAGNISAFDLETIQGINTKTISSSYPDTFDEIVAENSIAYKSLLNISGSGILMFAYLSNTATYIYTNGKPSTNKGDIRTTCKYRITIDDIVLKFGSRVYTKSVSGNQADYTTSTFGSTLFSALSLSYTRDGYLESYNNNLGTIALSSYISGDDDNEGKYFLEMPVAFNESLKIEAGMGTTGINTLDISGCKDVSMALAARYILL